jgi:hypothetical protein
MSKDLLDFLYNLANWQYASDKSRVLPLYSYMQVQQQILLDPHECWFTTTDKGLRGFTTHFFLVLYPGWLKHRCVLH